MVLVLDRSEFKRFFASVVDVIPDNSILWIPEQRDNVTCTHFLQTSSFFDPLLMWDWAKENLKGKVLCFSMSHLHEAWWGFTDESDVALFILRWS
jgi:hypothetical protein